MARINKHDALLYINKYIENEYPMYFREFGEGREKKSVELMSFVNRVYRELKSMPDVDDSKLVSGNMYQEMDRLIKKCINENFSKDVIKDIEDKFYMFYDYVRDVIRETGKIEDEDYLDKLSWYVTGIVGRNFDYRRRPFSISKDMIIDNFKILEKGIKNYQKIDEIISSLAETSKKKIGFDETTLDRIYCDIAVDMYKRNIPDDKIGEYVKDEFLKRTADIIKKVNKRILMVIASMDAPFMIPDEQVLFEISFEATMTGEISAVSLIDGKLDGYIMEKANAKRMRNIPDYKVKKHIYDVLVKEKDEDITDREFSPFVGDVYKLLTGDDYNFSSQDILEHKCDDIIRQLYLDRFHKYYISSKKMMKEQSVKQPTNKKNKPVDYVKRRNIIKRIQQDTAKLLIALVIGGSLGVVAGTYINRREDNEAISVVQSMDETDYTIDKTSYETQSKDYSRIVNGIIDYYNKLKQYGDEYAYLCFYEAYSENLSMTQMDTILSRVRHSVAKVEELNDLYMLVKDVDCYYEYMYDSLREMGCVEILDEKYMLAIVSYRQSYYGNLYGIVSDYHLHQEDRFSLERLTQLYEEYSRKMQIELGDKINNTETDSFANVGTGRSI